MTLLVSRGSLPSLAALLVTDHDPKPTKETAKVVTGMVVNDVDFNKVEEQKANPEKMLVENIPGMNSVKVRWIVSGGGSYKIRVDSAKGGVAEWKK